MNKFLNEILEQPVALKQTLDFYQKNAGKVHLQSAINLYRKREVTEIILTGMGSSFFTAYLASCLLNENGIRSHAINAGELLHYHFSLLEKGTLLVCISQSGESYEIVEIIKKLAGACPCIALTNEETSTLAQKGTAVLLSKAGHEEMTSSKSYVSIALVKLILGWSLAGKWYGKKQDEAIQFIALIEELLSSYESWMPEISRFLGDYGHIELIGRGPSYASVMQGALMFREAVRNPAVGNLGGEFRHGPMEMVKEGFRAVVFAPEGNTFNQSIKMAQDIAGYGGKVLLLTNRDHHFPGSDVHVFRISVKDEYLFAIGSIVPLQLMVNFRAIELGLQPGFFTRGAKVTQTE